MSDIYEQIYQALTPKLPRKEDADLLRFLLDAQKEGGKEAVKALIEKLIEEIEEGEG